MWQQFCESGPVVVIHVDLRPDGNREREAQAWFNVHEWNRWHRFVDSRPQREFTLCRAALRAFLCRRLGCLNEELAFEVSEFGKPFALVQDRPVPVTFNVSHSGSHGLIAVAKEGRIGVDLEERCARRDLDGYIQTLFAPSERAELEAARGPRRIDLFYRLWTMKEALVKADGMGLSLDTTKIEIPSTMYRGACSDIFRFWHTPTIGWYLKPLCNNQFAAALAYELRSESSIRTQRNNPAATSPENMTRSHDEERRG